MSSVSNCVQKTEKMSGNISRERKHSGTGLSFDMTSLKESLALAEMKAAAASREIVKNLDIKHQLRKLSGSENGYVPPKQILMYLVRMGSFTNKPKLAAEENPDLEIDFLPATIELLLDRCKQELKDLPAPFTRHWKQISDGKHAGESVRVMQWNHLSQTLGTKCDKYVQCEPRCLQWPLRRWRIIEELIRYSPDIICLQEVDHFDILDRALGSVGYIGKFVPKPDSPCIYMEENTGPDGCALFFRVDKYSLVSFHSRILQVWRVESNQVAMCAVVRDRVTGQELALVTTHLKARKGALLSTLRAEQGADILAWLAPIVQDRPVIITGDFNGPPSEPMFSTMTNNDKLPLNSSYDTEPNSWTTWKIRDTGEEKYILDYIFHSPELKALRVLGTPDEESVGADRLPSLTFPSDHISLVADFTLPGVE